MHAEPFLLQQPRCAGVLLHPTSIPQYEECSTFRECVFKWIDYLHRCGFRVWQMLPLGPTHEDRSPYQGLSVFAGDPQLLGLVDIAEKYSAFKSAADEQEKQQYADFLQKQQFWLQDYALFSYLRANHESLPWWEWPAELRDRHTKTVEQLLQDKADDINLYCYEQFLFYREWQVLREYAHSKNIKLFGDLPIFVAQDSAEVWAHREIFKLSEEGVPEVVAGVPPDYFSETGQRWGNPVYDWAVLKKKNYQWWLERLAYQFELFDLVRIDHFRGFAAYWEIPAEEETAMNGYWVDGPGHDFFEVVQRELPQAELVAEDLGYITEDVIELRDYFGLPGMKIMQFAFGGDAGNPYLPHHHVPNCVVYTGTHDNDTLASWAEDLEEHVKKHIHEYCCSQAAIPDLLISSAAASPAQLAIFPLQDLLYLGKGHRMNTPGVKEGNWSWQFDWRWLTDETAARMHDLLLLYGRC